nr:MAG TPA: hypothetical protein [Caudoviricetes sp.]
MPVSLFHNRISFNCYYFVSDDAKIKRTLLKAAF